VVVHAADEDGILRGLCGEIRRAVQREQQWEYERNAGSLHCVQDVRLSSYWSDCVQLVAPVGSILTMLFSSEQ
jgi:hypothetical protein